MPATPMKSLGTVLSINFASTTYTPITGKVTIAGPSLKYRTKETTNLESTAAEYMLTIRESGELTVDLQWNWGNTTHASLYDLYRNQDITGTGMHLIFQDDNLSQLAFTGLITDLPVSGIGFDDHAKVSMKVQINGDVTLTTTA